MFIKSVTQPRAMRLPSTVAGSRNTPGCTLNDREGSWRRRCSSRAECNVCGNNAVTCLVADNNYPIGMALYFLGVQGFNPGYGYCKATSLPFGCDMSDNIPCETRSWHVRENSSDLVLGYPYPLHAVISNFCHDWLLSIVRLKNGKCNSDNKFKRSRSVSCRQRECWFNLAFIFHLCIIGHFRLFSVLE